MGWKWREEDKKKTDFRITNYGFLYRLTNIDFQTPQWVDHVDHKTEVKKNNSEKMDLKVL